MGMKKRWLGGAMIVLGALALAASAPAECAWMLWMRADDDTEWRLAALYSMTGRDDGIAAFTTKQDCDRTAKLRNDEQQRAFDAARKGGMGLLRSTKLFTCLPDTVDPRGPKGK